MKGPEDLDVYHKAVIKVLPEDLTMALRVLGVSLTCLFRTIPQSERQEEMVNRIARLLEVEFSCNMEEEDRRSLH